MKVLILKPVKLNILIQIPKVGSLYFLTLLDWRLTNTMNTHDIMIMNKRICLRRFMIVLFAVIQRFNTWKVRKDLVDVDRVQQRVAERRRTALEAANRQQQQDDKLNRELCALECVVSHARAFI